MVTVALGSPRTGDLDKSSLEVFSVKGSLERSARSPRRRYRPSLVTYIFTLSEPCAVLTSMLISRRPEFPISVGAATVIWTSEPRANARGGKFQYFFGAGIATWQQVVARARWTSERLRAREMRLGGGCFSRDGGPLFEVEVLRTSPVNNTGVQIRTLSDVLRMTIHD